MNNNQIINNIIANTAAPAEILEAFRQEANESGYDLSTERGTDWYANRSILAQWHRDNNAAQIAARTVEFSWDFEEVGTGEFVKNIHVENLEIAGINEYAQDNGLAAARRYVKKLAKQAGKIFKEVTDEGMGKDFAIARLQAINESR